MAKLFVLSILINLIVTINSHSMNYRVFNSIPDDESEQASNDTIDSSSVNHRCIPVQAVKEIGCALSTKHEIFKGVFQTVCERHQLCYACGFAIGIKERQCNRMALKQMKEICLSESQSSPCLDFFKQRFAAGILLRSQTYLADSDAPEFVFECQQQCVVDYLNSK